MFYLINKRKGISSFKAIREFAKKLGIKKIGHTGTLDPMASGLLLVATEKFTKLITYLDQGYKTYEVEMILGSISDTYDAEGTITKESDVIPSQEAVLESILSFQGFYHQSPPIFSAKKVNGVRSYALARKGQEVKLKKVEVEINEISEIKQIDNITYSFQVQVSRGTYIRSLVFDIGKKLQVGAYMSKLTRTKLGSDLKLDFDDYKVVDPKTILDFPFLEINSSNLEKVKTGSSFKQKSDSFEVCIITHKNNIVAIAKTENNLVRPFKILI